MTCGWINGENRRNKKLENVVGEIRRMKLTPMVDMQKDEHGRKLTTKEEEKEGHRRRTANV